MSEHAGFAVAITLRERVLNDSILLSYHAGNAPHQLAGQAGRIPGDPPPVRVDFFLEPPRIHCSGDDPDRFTVLLSGWGRLTIVWGGTNHVRTIRWSMRLLVRARFVVADTEIRLRPEPGDVTLDDWEFDVLAGAAYPPDVDLYLRGGIFADRLQAAATNAIASRLLDFPPINADFLGPVVQAANMETGVRVVDGAIVVGLDIMADDITTTGDAGLLADFARNNDIAAVTNPVAVPVIMRKAEQSVRDEAASRGATLERLTITAQEGHFRVAGRASHWAGSVSFSLSVIPVMFGFRPGAFLPFPKKTVVVKARTWPALAFRTADVDVSVDRASWVVLVEAVGALLGGIVPMIIEDFVRRVTAQVTFAAKNTQVQAPVPRVRRLPPLVPGDPAVRVEIAEFEIHTTGVFTGITLRPEATPPALTGLTSIPQDIDRSLLEYRVQLPLDLLQDDPMLRIRWTIIDLDSGTVLVNDDNVANGRLSFEFVPAVIGASTSRFGIMCRVYRTLGAHITDYLNDGIRLDVHAPLPPGSYVRWRYSVKNPQVAYSERGSSWWYAHPSELVVDRWSALHRLDKPCKMVTRRSRYAQRRVEYLDALPFPVKYILDRRDTVCEYCFFGGPGKLLPSL
ncbi:hypothetical protein ABZW18_00400 [Streptomyces sp. NPDC004647]|uniref:hypothetical protein n=1 Tax=Streptomyces sp. NPDC004647 TaxID=3154671 RepID=UPI0033AEC93C